MEPNATPESRVFALTRPDPNLLTCYFVRSLLATIAFPLVFPVLFFRYHTLRYRFDEAGVSMSWGLLFRREINLTYARIQDIHISRGLVERWLGLGTIAIQTASGASGAEMTLDGIRDYDMLRDFLYARMRGRRGAGLEGAAGASPASAAGAGPASEGEALQLLRAIHDDLAAIRRALGPGGEGR